MAPATSAAAVDAAGGTRDRVLYVHQSPASLEPDVASDLDRYRRWVATRERWRLSLRPPPPPGPEIDVLLALDGARPEHLDASLRSLRAQTAPRWHLSVTVVGTPQAHIEELLDEHVVATGHRCTRVHTQPDGTGHAACVAAVLEETSSPACLVLSPGDELVADAIAQLSAALIDADVAYADEDRVGEDGLLGTPVLKPDWSPEFLLSWHYTGRPLALRVGPLVAAGGFGPVDDGDWEHDLVLRVTERTPRVAHISEVLCHRRGADMAGIFAGPIGSNGDASAPTVAGDGPAGGSAAVVAALKRRRDSADVRPGPLPGTWTVTRRRKVLSQATPAATAIVPFKDSTTLLRRCADSLAGTTQSLSVELVLVDNGSTEPETATLLDELGSRPGVTVVRDDRPFNWASINNAAARSARGDVLLFLNDDVEALADGWLDVLHAQAMRDDIGAVGARLVYPGGAVQHAGVVVGMTGPAGHVLAGLPGDAPGYLGMAVLARDVAAVTGACMATRREVFERLEGFDESLWLDFNDIDYCLRARARGLRILYEPGAELVHRESASRGTSGTSATAVAFGERWQAFLRAGDPFLNANLSRRTLAITLDEPGRPDDSSAPRADARTGGRAR